MSSTLEKERAITPLQSVTNVSEQLQRALNWALTSEKVPNQMKVSMLTSMWLLSVEMFHRQEDEALVSGKYNSSLHEHRYLLSELIAKGEKLVIAAKQNGIDTEAPFKFEDLQAAVESLHIAFHAEHRNANSEEINKEIAKLFPDEE